MQVAYVAQTESCVFLLDGDGFCRAAIPAADADDAARKAAQRCMDAQYVASLDLDAEGLLVSDPKPGRQMLFAKVGPTGKVALIRTAPLLEMRSLDGPMPLSKAEPDAETIISLDEDPDDAIDAQQEDSDCTELTAPFSRERPVPALAVRERESAPATLQAPRTVRGFPPPPPIPITSRRGILPRRASPESAS